MASREIWAERVRDWGESGLTAAEYAAKNELNPKTLSFYKWKLGADGLRTGDAHRALDVGADAAAPSFIELLARSEPSTPRRGLELEVRGVKIHVPEDFDEATLVRLISVLERRP